MVCKKCGKRLKKGENFCAVCGYYNDPDDEGFEQTEDTNESLIDDEMNFNDDNYDVVETEEIEEDDDVDTSSLINNTNVSDDNTINEFSLESDAKTSKKLTNFKDDRFVEAFIGEDYKWIIKRPVNIYALLLSWVYFLYRKMYITGTIGLIITGLVCKFLLSYIIIYIAVVMILSGLLFNPLYKLYVNFRIKKIREHNYGTDDFTIEQICQEKGGTSLVIALVIFFVFIVVMFRTYYRLVFNHENTRYWTENSENKANCTSTVKADYKILEEKEVTGILEEAVCNIRRTNSTKSYDVYIKIKDNEKDSYKIIYFKDDKTQISIEGLTVSLEELQTKNRNNTITEEEKDILNRLLEINKQYTKVSEDSKNEDQLIKTKKNKDEKLNYIIPKDEILR